MKRIAAILLSLSAALTSTACLKTETTHVLYLSPDGAVSWVVRDHDVHSDDANPARGAEEEASFLRDVQGRTYPPLLALEALGGRGAATDLLRAERPWEARTSARFERIDGLAGALLRELGIDGKATLSTAGGRTTLRVTWANGDIDDDGADGPVLALIEELEAYRLVLTGGRFVEAEGFSISDDGRTASPVEQAWPAGAPRHLSLTWTIR